MINKVNTCFYYTSFNDMRTMYIVRRHFIRSSSKWYIVMLVMLCPTAEMVENGIGIKFRREKVAVIETDLRGLTEVYCSFN